MILLRAMVLAFLAAGCAAPVPRPIAYGTDPCAHCHMTITEARFGAELMTRKGQTLTFDDPACLAAFVAEGHLGADQIEAMRVNDFLHPDAALDARSAAYLRSDRVTTPMGGGIIALRAGAEADSVRRALGGLPLSWQDLVRDPGHR